MIQTFKDLIAHQFEAALCTLAECVDRCPDAVWNAPVANLAFCQVTFHTLFFTDVYLGADEASFRAQSYHRDHAHVFRDYEEMEDRPQQLLYDKPAIHDYLAHCRQKLASVLAAETADSLAGPCGFARRAMSRAELYVYNVRHVQHHAAQLSLRLKLNGAEGVPWVASGWRDLD